MSSLTPVLLLQAAPADAARMLRGDALNLGLGIVLLGVGVAAVLVYLRAFRHEAAALPWFGLFTFLYGSRLLMKTATLALLLGVSASSLRYASAAITYAIVVPGVLFARAMFPRWRRPLALAALGLAAFAICAVCSDIVRQRPFSAQAPNNVLAIALIGLALALGFRPGLPRSRDLRTLRIGLASVSAAALVDNLRGLGLIGWPRSEVEPLGATVLIACLGLLVAHRTLEGAQRLLALDKELGIARRIQSSILPRSMPAIAGLAVAARYEPMTAVAGDFYDFLEMGERRLGVLIADVSGHGVPAALIASMVKVAIAAQRPRGDRPAEVLTGMNETLQGQLGGQYVTAAYLFVDRAAGVMRYSAAGHPPLLRWRPCDGQAVELEKNGLPLGLMDVAEYQELEQSVRPGDRFLLYTDGLADAANAAGEFFGIERVKAEIAAAAGLSPDGMADRILEKARRWTSEIAGDDLTFVLVDCL